MEKILKVRKAKRKGHGVTPHPGSFLEFCLYESAVTDLRSINNRLDLPRLL